MNPTWPMLKNKCELWLKEAREHYAQLPDHYFSSPTDRGHNAMALATVTSSQESSVRIVLLKGIDERGMTFFTNYESQKGQDILSNNQVAGTFYWPFLGRQLRFKGVASKVSREESQEYWATRPLNSQISGTLSPQGRPLSDFNQFKQKAVDLKKSLEKEKKDSLPCPDNWGGYFISLTEIEFWSNDPYRLHFRELYKKDLKSELWSEQILAP